MATPTLRFEIASPDRLVLTDEVEELQVPGKTGYLGILPGHAPMITEVAIGDIAYRKEEQTFYFAVACGYCEVLLDQVTVLAEKIERAEEIDRRRAQASLQRAEKRLSSFQATNIDFLRARTSLQRALIRIQVSHKTGLHGH